MNPESHDNVSRLKQLKERPAAEHSGDRKSVV